MTEPTEKNFIDWENHVFGFGYGTGETFVLGALRKFLEAVGDDRGPDTYDYESLERAVGFEAAWLLINTLCKADIIEYGTSPRYGWLTEQGRALRKFVLSRPLDDLVNIVCKDREANDYCAPDVCNCGPKGYEEGRRCPNPFWITR